MKYNYRVLSRIGINPIVVNFEVKFGNQKKTGTSFIANVWGKQYYLRTIGPATWIKIVTTEEEGIFEECTKLEEEYNKEVKEEKKNKLK
jgi:hypothetical protein